MKNFDRRIERLEEKLGAKREPRVIIITNFNDFGDNDLTVELSPGRLWAYAARGGPFSDDEIRELRETREGG